MDATTRTVCDRKEEVMDDLKRCPFCGHVAESRKKRGIDRWIVECTNPTCPASYMIGWDYDTEEEAIEAWNRRAKNET